MNVQTEQIISLFIALPTLILSDYSSQQDECPGEAMARMIKLGKNIATQMKSMPASKNGWAMTLKLW